MAELERTPEEQAAEAQRLAAEHAAAEAQATANPAELTETEADDAFRAGFDGAPYKEPTPEPTKETPEAPVAESQPVPTPEQATLTKEQGDKLLRLLTEHEQLKGSVEQRFGTAFGKVGGLERMLKEIRDLKAGGQPVKLTRDDLKELKLAGFEDLADSLIPGLERALSKVSVPVAPQTFDHEAVQRVLAEERAKDVARLQEQCVKDLNELAPGWREIVGDPNSSTPWREWLKTQPPHYQRRINRSWNADEVLESIERFKASQDDAARAIKPKPSSDARKELLKEAVTKRSSPARDVSKSDDEMFEEGFKSGPAGSLLQRT